MQQKSGGLSLERFAKAKQSGYDRKAKKAKELALNAKKVNKYRKLKQKLAAKGLLEPSVTYEQQEGQNQMYDAHPRRPRDDGESAMERIHARAGPAPESAEESGDDEMLGQESDGDSGSEAAEQRLQSPTPSKHHAAQQKRRRLVPQGPSSQYQNSDPVSAASEGTGIRKAPADPGRHQPEASAAGGRHAHQGRADNGRAKTNCEHEHEDERQHKEGHKAEAQLGQKQKRGEKKKPASQLQRVQAEVQAKKEAEQREREERRKRIKEHASKVAEAQRRRKEHTKVLRKRTHQGQPVMRYRMDKILGQLQAEAAQH